MKQKIIFIICSLYASAYNFKKTAILIGSHMHKIFVFLYISFIALSFTAAGATDSTDQIKQFHVTYTQYSNYHEPGMNTEESTVLSIDHTGKVEVTTTRTDHKKRRPKEEKCRESSRFPIEELAEFIKKLDSLEIDSLQKNYLGIPICDLTRREKLVIEIEKIKTEVTIEGEGTEIPVALSSIISFLEEIRKKYLKKCN